MEVNLLESVIVFPLICQLKCTPNMKEATLSRLFSLTFQAGMSLRLEISH